MAVPEYSSLIWRSSEGIVYNRMNALMEYADSYYEEMSRFLDTWNEAITTLDIPTMRIDLDGLNIPDAYAFQAPSVPEEPTITFNEPSLPSHSIGTIRDPAYTTAPEFTEPDPSITFPPLPEVLDLPTLPTAPDVDTDITLPSEPVYNIPSVPTLEELSIPDAPTLDYPTFDAVAPTDDVVAPPGLTFYWSEDDYTDDCVLEAVQDKLCDTLVNGGTGLNPEVEQAIWDRARNREDYNSKRTEDEIVDSYASRGFNIPPGAEYGKLQQSYQEQQNKLSSINRDIAIKQAELEQENVRHAITEAIRLEDTLIGHWNNRMQRAYDAARFTQEAGFRLFEAQVSYLNARISLYRMAVEAYEIRIRGEIARLEAYKAEIDAQRLIGDINEQAIRIYATQIDTLRVRADIYRTNMEAVRLQIEAEQSKVDVYRSQLEGYSTAVEARASEYDLYRTQIDAELSKVQVFDSKVNAFVSRIQGYAAQVDASTKITDADINKERLRLEEYNTRVNAQVSAGRLDIDYSNARVQVFAEQLRAYSSELQAESVKSDVWRKEVDAIVQKYQTEANVAVAESQANITRAIESGKLYLGTLEAETRILAQLTSAALTGINVSAGISGSGSESISNNVRYEGN